MLEKVKLAARIGTDVFDSELLDLIAAGIADLMHIGVRFDYTFTSTDYTIDDPLASRAVVTYCRMNFGSPADYDRLKAAYDEMKGQLRESSGYGLEAL